MIDAPSQREWEMWRRYLEIRREERKPNFLTYFNYHHATIAALFQASGVNPSLIEAVCAQIQVPEHVATLVIEALNKVAKTNYTLDDMSIPINKKEEGAQP